MAVDISLEVQPREPDGTNAARRLRRLTGRVPGILYGAQRPPATFSLESRVLAKAMEQEAFFSQIVELKMGEQTQQVVLRDLQRHPATDRVLHIDFMRISEDQIVQISVPIHYINEDTCEGVRVDGGTISRSLIEVEIACLPRDLPEFIEVDLEDLCVGQSIHLSDLTLSESVQIMALIHGSEHDISVVSVQPPRGGLDAEMEDDEGEIDQDEIDGDAPSADEA